MNRYRAEINGAIVWCLSNSPYHGTYPYGPDLDHSNQEDSPGAIGRKASSVSDEGANTTAEFRCERDRDEAAAKAFREVVAVTAAGVGEHAEGDGAAVVLRINDASSGRAQQRRITPRADL
jgi:hypothetical protein